MSDDENTYYDNENMEINPNQPIDMTMKLPAKSHLGKLEVKKKKIVFSSQPKKKNGGLGHFDFFG